MLGRLKDQVSHLEHDTSIHKSFTSEHGQSKIELLLKEYNNGMNQLKVQTTAKIDCVNEEIKHFLAMFEGHEADKNEFLKGKYDEIRQINAEFAMKIEKLKRERDEQIKKLVAEDEAAIRHLQKQREEEILRIEAENNDYIELLREALEEDIAKSKEKMRELIFKARQKKDAEIQKYAADYQSLKDKYNEF